MNKIIEEQLRKCRVAVVPEFTDTATHIYINKVNVILPTNMLYNRVYLIKIKDSVRLNDALAFNWNGGRKPMCTYYKAEKVSEIGNMIKLNGVAVDDKTGDYIYNQPFYGYLPNDGFEIIEEV